MLSLDYSNRGRRPSAQQILSDWKKAGSPREFEATYGETFAHFKCHEAFGNGRWYADGNGCEGIKRDKVESLLNNR